MTDLGDGMDDNTLRIVILGIIGLVIIGAVAWRRFNLVAKGPGGFELGLEGHKDAEPRGERAGPAQASAPQASSPGSAPGISQTMDRSPGGTQIAGSGNTVIHSPVSAGRDIGDVGIGGSAGGPKPEPPSGE